MNTIGSGPADRTADLLTSQMDGAAQMTKLSLKLAKMALAMDAAACEASGVEEALALLDIRA